jgi:formate-dependent nitrite reductase membrane component NrfD
LAPACAIVCPTEAIIPGDFHDPKSVVSRMRSEGELSARKVEAGTGPNVLYREVADAGLDPTRTSAAGGYLWANQIGGPPLDAERFLSLEKDAEVRARTTYDVDHPVLWGTTVGAYLFTKSLAAGLFLVQAAMVAWSGREAGGSLAGGLSVGSLFFLLVTTVLLVADLKRPERFLFIVFRPNWSSWLARGAFVLMAFGAVVTAWTAVLLLDLRAGPVVETALLVVGSILAALTACYTGWLFAQAKGRVLWMRRGLWLHLIVHSIVAGAAVVLCIAAISERTVPWARPLLLVALAVHLAFALTQHGTSPSGREREFRRAMLLLTRGPFARRHLLVSIGIGVVVPSLVLALPLPAGFHAVAALLVLGGLFIDEDVLVKAGQALPIS